MKSIFSLLKGKKHSDKQKEQTSADGIMKEEAVLKEIKDKLDSLYRGNPGAINGRTLVFYVNDTLMYPIVKSQDFHDRLLCGIASSGLNLYDVEFTDKPMPEDATRISGTIGAGIKEIPEKSSTDVQTARRATISIYNGKGSLAQEKYVVEAEGCPYFIGRDNIPLHMEKAISVPGDKELPKYELNKYARTRHAQIHFHANMGFYLLVEKDGSQVHGGSRTQIRRKGKNIEVRNLQVPYRLYDDDVIILGKSVELLFSEEQGENH